MISVSEYSRSRGITRESVNKQIRKRPEELEGHVFPNGKSFDLDEAAVEYLDSHRQPRVITIEPMDAEVRAEINQLEETVENLRKQLAESQSRIIALQDEKVKLIEQNGKYQGMIESNDRERKEKDERIKACDQKIADQDALIRDQEQTISANRQQITDLEHRAADQKEELDLYEKTIFGLYRKRKRE